MSFDFPWLGAVGCACISALLFATCVWLIRGRPRAIVTIPIRVYMFHSATTLMMALTVVFSGGDGSNISESLWLLWLSGFVAVVASVLIGLIGLAMGAQWRPESHGMSIAVVVVILMTAYVFVSLISFAPVT